MATIQKATDLLFVLSGHGAPCGVTTLARELRIPKSSVHRLLSALRHRNLVERDDQRRYRLGVGLAALGLSAWGRDPLVPVAHPIMEAHARSLGETFFLVCARGGELVVADKVEGRGFLRASPPVGSTVPIHATAVGRTFIAFGPELVDVEPSSLQAYTRRTPATPQRLRRAVVSTQAAGYAVSRDDWLEGLAAVAAPVRVAGRMHAAVAAALVSARFRELGERRVAEAALAAAAEISTRFEGRQP